VRLVYTTNLVIVKEADVLVYIETREVIQFFQSYIPQVVETAIKFSFLLLQKLV